MKKINLNKPVMMVETFIAFLIMMGLTFMTFEGIKNTQQNTSVIWSLMDLGLTFFTQLFVNNSFILVLIWLLGGLIFIFVLIKIFSRLSSGGNKGKMY